MISAAAPLRSIAATSSQRIVLAGARVARSPFSAKHRTIVVAGPFIESIQMQWLDQARSHRGDEAVIDLSGYTVLPGLVNAHDHLDFSIFPRLGNGPYNNWKEWAADIYHPGRPPIDQLLRVPRETRVWWGGIRNLLCGVTSVSHHNRYLPEVFEDGFPVSVPAEYGWAHSVTDPEEVRESYRQTPSDWPFLIHVAEGTDDAAEEEFEQLQSLLPIDERVVLIHAVGLSSRQWKTVEQGHAGLVWCPSTNLFLLGRTLSVEQMRRLPNAALATDSPLTSTRDLLDEVRFVHREMDAPAPLLYELVTTKAARLLRLNSGQGELKPGGHADLIATKDMSGDPSETLAGISWRDIELVMQAGKVMLASAEIAARLPEELRSGMERIFVDGTKRFVRAPVQKLLDETQTVLGRPLSITGRSVESEGPSDAILCPSSTPAYALQ
ncbi:cytosine/adenosine deaminase-related metal-dependent hydrolase [Silvibacterium bohemicum]|uniref:Cytosine/adenosine deaminase-related metal-dependent hydrolase n=1 Tax=Silvibacterium bohemicum TaxID=1577686 RepID=A0A841K7N7_9BACT|nr:amidohydrolase family protein [Silvibacterium bohemicum]MBB6146598.1 cytosine/adenosine deaminase-related metal-dependent hydrolase [Silvibacterium bohemicum]